MAPRLPRHRRRELEDLPKASVPGLEVAYITSTHISLANWSHDPDLTAQGLGNGREGMDNLVRTVPVILQPSTFP